MDVRLIYPTAYVAHKSGLKILDVTNPEAPVLLGSYEFGDRYVHSIDLIDHYAFLGAREGIRILDVADPANPLLVEEHPMAGYGNVLVDGDNVYFYTHYSFQISEFGYSTDIEGGSGVSQIHFTLDNYPNPFNNETTIRYFLPSAGNVRIEIYDILGRKIETLSRGMCEAGSHSVIWNPKDAASGIYFYSIDVENFSRTNSCILLK